MEINTALIYKILELLQTALIKQQLRENQTTTLRKPIERHKHDDDEDGGVFRDGKAREIAFGQPISREWQRVSESHCEGAHDKAPPNEQVFDFSSILGLAFPDENINDSRLIITTRNPVVAKHLTRSVLQMKPLSHDESWEILTSKFQLPVTDDAPGTYQLASSLFPTTLQSWVDYII